MIPLLFCLLPIEPPPIHVEQIELNHFYDSTGKHVFDQYIIWQDGHVRAWRIAKPQDVPIRNHQSRTWQMLWPVKQHHIRIRTKSLVETFTQWDRELFDRQVLPPDQREPLGD